MLHHFREMPCLNRVPLASRHFGGELLNLGRGYSSFRNRRNFRCETTKRPCSDDCEINALLVYVGVVTRTFSQLSVRQGVAHKARSTNVLAEVVAVGDRVPIVDKLFGGNSRVAH